MSKLFDSTFKAGDIVFFPIPNPVDDNLSFEPTAYRSPSTYYYENPKFSPDEGINYNIVSVSYDNNRQVYHYEIKRFDDEHEDIMYVIFEDANHEIFVCITQTHFKPSRINMVKVELFQPTFQKDDIVSFLFPFVNVSRSSMRTPSTYYSTNPQFSPKEGIHYNIISVDYDKYRKVYHYQIERVDKEREDIMYVIFENSNGEFFNCITQTHFEPYQIDMVKV